MSVSAGLPLHGAEHGAGNQVFLDKGGNEENGNRRQHDADIPDFERVFRRGGGSLAAGGLENLIGGLEQNPAEEDLKMPSSDSYQAGEVRAETAKEYEETAPSAGRKSSDGLADGYFYFKELPALSGEISCSSDTDQEAFVTILYKDGDEILGGETSSVMIPAGKKASYVFTAAAPIPEDTESFEVSAFSIPDY